MHLSCLQNIREPSTELFLSLCTLFLLVISFRSVRSRLVLDVLMLFRREEGADFSGRLFRRSAIQGCLSSGCVIRRGG